MGTPAPDSVKRPVDHFDQDRKVFLSSDYKEEQLRLEFLNPTSPRSAGTWVEPLRRFGTEIGDGPSRSRNGSRTLLGLDWCGIVFVKSPPKSTGRGKRKEDMRSSEASETEVRVAATRRLI